MQALICTYSPLRGNRRLSQFVEQRLGLFEIGGVEAFGKPAVHTTVTTTKRYAHLADDPLRAATDRFGSKIAGFQNGGDADPVAPETGKR
jgi:hypothetical protein